LIITVNIISQKAMIATVEHDGNKKDMLPKWQHILKGYML
jgi:hypothetical protein